MTSQSISIISLKCSGCGSNLDITPEMDSFACGYCGTQQMVNRSGGTVSLRLIGDAIAKVQMGMDRTAAELAIRRLREDLAEIEAEKARLESADDDGNSVIGYLVILCGVLLLVSGVFFMNGALVVGCVGIVCAVLVGLAIGRTVGVSERLAAQRRKTFGGRSDVIRQQIAACYQIVKHDDPPA